MGGRRGRNAAGSRGPRRGVAGAIETHDGRLFKHTGDGVCAAFASPSAAVAAAIAAQRALELPVRMGLATGEAEFREGDYFGAVLNRAARVMSAGHGGQILLDGATAGLISDVDLIGLGSKAITRYRQTGRFLSGTSAGPAHRFSAVEDGDHPGEIYAHPPPASWDERLNSPTWKWR